MLYQYRAVDSNGKVSQGQLDALNEHDLAAQLQKLGLELIRAESKNRAKVGLSRKLPRRELMTFLFQMEMMLRAGVPLLTIIADSRDMAETPKLGNICAALYEKIDAGSTLSDAFAGIPGAFPEIMVNLVRAGEASGALPDILKEIHRSLLWQDELSAKAKQIMLYPIFVTTVIIAVIVFLMMYVVPQIIKFIAEMGGTLPFHTKLLIWLSNVFVQYWWLILPGPPVLILILFLLSKVSPRVKRTLHDINLRIPYIGQVVKKISLARISDTLGLTYETGISILEGLKFCGGVSNNVIVKEALEQARARIANGAPISQGFSSQKFFPPMVVRMLKIGEETGELGSALKNISYFCNRDVDESINRVQAMIEPTLTVFLGFILGWVMLAVMGPIYDTISKLK